MKMSKKTVGEFSIMKVNCAHCKSKDVLKNETSITIYWGEGFKCPKCGAKNFHIKEKENGK